MFELASNKEIGMYLEKTIKKKGFKSSRDFGRQCLCFCNSEPDIAQVNNMANRLSQMFKGAKSVQLEDLPAFTSLLGISCEELISAGKCPTTSSTHLTNYSIAASHDERDWEAYIAREDQIVLNADEYGRNVLDYALEFKNYALLKFLLEKGYIWFVADNPSASGYTINFGAGTSIKYNPQHYYNMCSLERDLTFRSELRSKMITLAIRENDLPMLEKLHARETPALLQSIGNKYVPDDAANYFDAELIDALSGASDKVLDYFSREFELTDSSGCKNHYVFPFLGQLIDALLNQKNNFSEWALKAAVAHNRYVFDSLSDLMALSVKQTAENFPYWTENDKSRKDFIQKVSKEWLRFHNGDFVRYCTSFDLKKGITSNFVHTKASSSDIKLGKLIDEVNELYDRIKTIEPTV